MFGRAGFPKWNAVVVAGIANMGLIVACAHELVPQAVVHREFTGHAVVQGPHGEVPEEPMAGML